MKARPSPSPQPVLAASPLLRLKLHLPTERLQAVARPGLLTTARRPRALAGAQHSPLPQVTRSTASPAWQPRAMILIAPLLLTESQPRAPKMKARHSPSPQLVLEASPCLRLKPLSPAKQLQAVPRPVSLAAARWSRGQDFPPSQVARSAEWSA